MFLDEAHITLQAGKGGNGCVSWRREKYVAKGGPNGGDGGRGGDIIFIANSNTDTLSNFASRKNYHADKGQPGSGTNKRGRSGEDLLLNVPPGTLVTEIDGETELLLGDLQEHGDQMLIVKGGRGGYGNAHFKSSVRQRPDFAERGEPGEYKEIKLELKMVADVGIIGFPSVGKSTLISVVSAAKPKIADYPFTTLVPNLGMVNVDDRSFVICDVPGLIQGASEGKGLGGTFLKHIERCGVLLHVLDITRAMGPDSEIDVTVLIQEYNAIRHELETHSPLLQSKKEYVVLNKIDVIPEDEWGAVFSSLQQDLLKAGIKVEMGISSAIHSGTEKLMKTMLSIVLKEREKQQEIVEEEEIPVLRPHIEDERMGAYRVERDGELLRVCGARFEQLVQMTDFSSEGGVRRLKDVMDRIGLLKALKREMGEQKMQVLVDEVDVTSLV